MTETKHTPEIPQGWRTIESAPSMCRILVCGWQKATRQTQGYWWWGEDVTIDGKPNDHKNATHWAPMVLPAFPPPPVQEKDHD